MLTPHFRAFAAIAICLPLSACGGGGGGAPSPSSPYVTPSVNFSPFIGSFESEGVTSHLILNSDANRNATGGTISPGSERRVYTTTTSPNPATTGPDDVQKIQITTPGLPTADNITGKIGSNGAGQYIGGGDGGTNGASAGFNRTLQNSLGVTSLSYSFLGSSSAVVTATPASEDFYAHAMFGGQKTLPTDMPKAGTANYSGAYLGALLHAKAGSPYVVTHTDGSVSMTADFGSGDVKGRVDDYRNVYRDVNGNVVDSTPINASVSFKGTMSGNAFSGTANITQKGTDTPLPNLTQSGYMQGGFFGPQAAEAAGSLTNKATGGADTYFTTGSFGAKKN